MYYEWADEKTATAWKRFLGWAAITLLCAPWCIAFRLDNAFGAGIYFALSFITVAHGIMWAVNVADAPKKRE